MEGTWPEIRGPVPVGEGDSIPKSKHFLMKLQGGFSEAGPTEVMNSSCLPFSVVKGRIPQIGEKVLVKAVYNPSQSVPWNALKVQTLSNQVAAGFALRVDETIPSWHLGFGFCHGANL